MEAKIEKKYLLTLTELEFIAIYHNIEHVLFPKKRNEILGKELAALNLLHDNMCDMLENDCV